MPSTTGIELGPDSCVLASVRTARRGVVDVTALHVIEPSEWPARELGVTEALRAARVRKRFPRRARVIAWSLPEVVRPDDAVARTILRPITSAGFRIDAVLTPPQALAALAASRPRFAGDGAVAWLAINMNGAAIAIISGGALMFARTFPWSYDRRPLAAKAQLLQRYSLVAQLAPEVRRGIQEVRVGHGLAVDSVVTCGDLPELRSLTMPLIEELDVEVETLDSTDGLRAVGKAKGDRFAELAPAMRLACAAGGARGARRSRSAVPVWARAAAAAAVVVALGWVGAGYLNRPTSGPHTAAPRQSAARSVVNAPVAVAPERRASTPSGPATPALPTALPSMRASGGAAAASTGKPAPSVAPPPAPPTRSAPPEKAAGENGARVAAAPPKKTGAENVARIAAAPSPGAGTIAPPARSTAMVARAADPLPMRRAEALSAPPQTAAPPQPFAGGAGTRQVPLKDPLPKVDSILIDQDRRLAIIDGAVVSVGDSVGARVVLRIEPDAVLLREPSGLAVRVSLRARTTS